MMASKERPRIRLRTDPTPQDLDAIRRITVATGYFRDDETEVAVELADERLKRGEASGYHFVFADTESACAGYACYGPIGCTVSSFDLYWIAVHPELQGAGVGTILIREVERRVAAMGGTRVYVETSSRPSYESTRRFYVRRGYESQAVLEDFYAPGDGKVIFVKRLGA
jgi:ribosomal protein S18 acetylase RimI-like enzyme